MKRHLVSAARAAGVLGLTELLTRTIVAVGVVAWVAYTGSTEAVVGAITSNPLYVPRAIATTSPVEFFNTSTFSTEVALVLVTYLFSFSASFRAVSGVFWGEYARRLARAAQHRFGLASSPAVEDLEGFDLCAGFALWLVAVAAAAVWMMAVLSVLFQVVIASPASLLQAVVVGLPSFIFALWVGDVVAPELLKQTGLARDGL